MSRQNSIKKILLENENSKKKKIVDCEINAWMETNRKQSKLKQKNNFYKPKSKKTSFALTEQTPTFINYQAQKHQHTLIIHKPTKKVPKSSSTQCSQPTLTRQVSPQQREQKEVNIRPFNMGYVLKEKRRRLLQQKTLKRYETPSTLLNSHSQMSIQQKASSKKKIKCRHRMFDVKSARFIATLQNIQ